MLSATDSFWQRNKERLLTRALLFVLAYSVVRNILSASIRPFWFDELCTWIVARQPDLPSVWRALASCVDGQPPPYYLLQRFFDHFISNDEIAFRISSILAFCLMEWCLFVWLKKRHNASVAFIACMLPFSTTLFTTYAIEARPYAVEVGFLSVALVAYQRVPAPFWTFALGLGLVAAESSHYYAIFVLLSFFAAEAAYYLKTKIFRFGVWLALFSGSLPLFTFWPLLSRFKAYYGAHVWYKSSTFFGTLKIYGLLFGISPTAPGAASWTNIIIHLLPLGILLGAALLLYCSLRVKPTEQPTFHWNILLVGILLSPLIMFCATKLSHTGLVPRYLLHVILGIALVAGYGLSFLTPRSLTLVGALLCLCIAAQETTFWISYYEARQLGFSTEPPAVPLINSAGHTNSPLVVSEGHDYLELDHYAPRNLVQRLTFVAAPDAAVAHDRPDSTEKDLLALREFAALRVVEYTKFKESNCEFLLYSDPTPENNPDWFVSWLSEEGWSLQVLKTDGHSSVFLVTPKIKTR